MNMLFCAGHANLGMELVALCDQRQEALADVSTELGVAAYADYDAFLEHDMDAVFTLADRISVLFYGRIIASGTVDEVRSNPEVIEAYLGGDHP